MAEETKLFIGNISYKTGERQLEDLFGPIGRIKHLAVASDTHTGRSKGFAFLTLEDPNDADEMIRKVNGLEIDGRTIRVELSTGRPSGRSGDSRFDRGGRARSRDRDHRDDRSGRDRSRERSRDRGYGRDRGAGGGRDRDDRDRRDGSRTRDRDSFHRRDSTRDRSRDRDLDRRDSERDRERQRRDRS